MNIFKMEVKRGLKSLTIWSVVCILLLILFLSMFPSMKDAGMQELVDTKLGALPPALLEAFNLEQAPDFSKLNEYFAYVFQYIVIAGCIYGGILGAKSLIQEESEGTIEFLYAHPASRTKLVTMKLLANFVLFYLFAMILGIATVAMCMIVKPADLSMIDVVTDIKLLYGGLIMVGLVFMAIGFLISVLVKNLRLAMPVSTGLFFVTYLLGIFAGMIDQLEFLKYLSPFYYAVPSDLVRNGFEAINIVLSLVIIVVSIASTYMIYRKKDFRV